MKKYLSILFLLWGTLLFAQNDTLRLKNNNLIDGEVKSIFAGILTIETVYSDKDFTIEFTEVSELIIERKCIVVLTKGRDFFGYVRSKEPGKVTITTEDGVEETVPISHIIGLQEVKDKFFSRFTGAIDLGFNVTKASNAKQFNIAGRLSFTGRKWIFEGNINNLSSTQDNAEDVTRLDANLQTLRLLKKDWFLGGEVTFLQNTEQALDARWSPNITTGKLVASNSKMYLGISAGFNFNIENYVDPALDKTSGEFLFKADLNVFDVEDLDITSDLKVLPSLTEKGRVRSDFNFNISYDLPWDFYIKFGATVNYDNQPAIVGNQYDYILKTGFGWKFND
ncbi:MAG: DUF481 domain-containing protein [Flavobacteriaceae bacterium]